MQKPKVYTTKEYRKNLEERVFRNRVIDIGKRGDPICREGDRTVIIKGYIINPCVGDLILYKHSVYQTRENIIYAEPYRGKTDGIKIVEAG